MGGRNVLYKYITLAALTLSLSFVGNVLLGAGQVGYRPRVLNDLRDVNAGSPSDNDYLTWDNGTSMWIPEAITTFTVGTANTIPKWNGTPDDLTDSNLLNAGVPAAGASGNVLTLDATYNAMDGSDTVAGLYLDATNYDSADHTGSTNVFSMLYIEGITQDGQASEYGIYIADGWDNPIYFAGASDIVTGAGQVYYGSTTGTFIRVGSTNIGNYTNGSGVNSAKFQVGSASLHKGTHYVQIVPASIGTMDGSDTTRGLYLDLDSNAPDHTGSSNFFYGLDITGITGDADATEGAINIGAGWDHGLSISADGSATTNNIALGASQDGIIYHDGTNQWFTSDDTAGHGMRLRVDTTGTLYFDEDGGYSDLQYDPANTTNTGFDILDLIVTAVYATNGSDEINMFHLDWNETDWATDSEVWSAIKMDDMTQDAQGTYNIFYLGDGPDYLINDVTDTALGTLSWTTNSDKDANTAAGTLKVYINGTLYHIQLYADS
jgi:hypothetical protein